MRKIGRVVYNLSEELNQAKLEDKELYLCQANHDGKIFITNKECSAGHKDLGQCTNLGKGMVGFPPGISNSLESIDTFVWDNKIGIVFNP